MVRLGLGGWLVILLSCSGAGCIHTRQPQPPPLSADESALRIGPPGRPALVYRRGTDGLKPYVQSLVTPGGVELLRDEPPGHEHHHGLMLAVGVDDVDFWGERYAEIPGRQSADSEQWAWQGWDWPSGAASLSSRVQWTDPRDGSVRLEEARWLICRPGTGPAPLELTWISVLSVPQGRERAALWGRAYFGLGLRFAEPFERAGCFFNSDGAEGVVVRGDERLTAARWCAYTAEVGGRTVTVAMFDHPQNPRHPARFFTMADPFAYLSATLDLAEHPLELTPAEPIELAWGLAAWDAPVTPEEIDQTYRAWVAGAPFPKQAAPQAGPASQGD